MDFDNINSNNKNNKNKDNDNDFNSNSNSNNNNIKRGDRGGGEVCVTRVTGVTRGDGTEGGEEGKGEGGEEEEEGKLDPAGSTVGYEMMKLCTGSVLVMHKMLNV